MRNSHLRSGTRAAWAAGLLALALVGVACDGSTGPETARVPLSIQLRVTGGEAAGSVAQASGAAATEPLAIEGTNGVLSIDDIRLIVAEFELERVDGECAPDADAADGGSVSLAAADDDDGEDSDDGDDDGEDEDDDDGDDDECEEFEAPPAFLDIPLEGGETVLVRQSVPAGVYEEIEFEVESLEDDDDGEHVAGLVQSIRDEFPDWPASASMLVSGIFTPTGGGEAQPFRAYFEAEIEVELEFDTPIELTAADPDPAIVIELDVGQWFRRGDGSVLDLSAFDYETTGVVVEFEAELGDGFTDVEFDEDDD